MKQRFICLLTVFMVLTLLLTGCGAPASGNSGIAKEDFTADGGYMDNETIKNESLSGELADSTAGGSDRKIIQRASYEIETKDLDTSVAALETAVSAVGGYYESSNTYGSTEAGGRGTYVLRIPADSLNSFTADLSALGSILSQSRSGEDVTTQYYDTEAELASLRIQQERLMALLEKAETLEEILLLEKELTEVRTSIETLTTTLNRYDDLIDYSTVTITLRQVEVYTEITEPGLGQQIADTFGHTLSFAGNLLTGILLAVVWLSPYLLTGAVITVVIILLVKRKKK